MSRRFRGVVDLGAVLDRPPYHTYRLFRRGGERYRVRVFRTGHCLEAVGCLLREFRTVDDQANLRVQMPGPLVQVHRTYEQTLTVEHIELRVQRIVSETRNLR